jgi:membrane associated rhomboid family serine protease
LSESSRGRAVSISVWWLVLLVVFLVIEIAFLIGAYTSGMAGLERIFGVFTGLILVTFGIILYAGRLIFYD